MPMNFIPEAAWLPLLAQLAAKATLVLALAAAAAAVLWRSSAAVRHLVWCVGVVGVLALPLFSILLPAWNLPLLPASTAAAPARSDAPALPQAMPGADAVEALPANTVEAAPPAAEPAAWLPGALAALATGGMMVGLLWLAVGFWGVERLGRRAEVVRDPEWLRAAHDEAERLGLRRPVLLLRSRGAVMPATWGLLWPSVVLPAAAAEWPEERRRAVLAHELAHVKRFDCLTQALAQVACALFWWHPAVWYAARRLRVERERACDDLVLRAGARASDYAAHLLEIARAYRTLRLGAPALVSMAKPSHLESRLLWVLDGARARTVPSVRATFLTVLAGLLVVVPLAAMRPAERSAPRTWPFAAMDPAAAEVPAPVAVEIAAEAAVEGTDVRKPAEAEGLSAAPEPHPAPGRDRDTIPSVEELIALRSAGVTVQYIAELRAAGYTDLTTRQLTSMAANGVTSRYAAEMNGLGFGRLTPEQLASFRAVDVTPAYLAELRRHGYGDLSVHEVTGMRAVGVDAAYVREMNATGFGRISAQRLVGLRAVGVTPAYLDELRRHGFAGLSLQQVEGLKALGVTGGFIEGMRAARISPLNAEILSGLSAMGVTPAYVRELAEVGLNGLSAQQLIDLKAMDVTAGYVREMRAAGIGPLTVDQLVRLRASGVERELVRSRQRPPAPERQ